jgi:hypothetical protein
MYNHGYKTLAIPGLKIYSKGCGFMPSAYGGINSTNRYYCTALVISEPTSPACGGDCSTYEFQCTSFLKFEFHKKRP